MSNPVSHKVEGTSLTIERVFDAPQEVVFDAFSSGESLAQWWSPQGFSIPVSKMDFKVGGTWHYMMKAGPDMGDFSNQEFWNISTYDEIDRPNKIVLRDAFSDETGEPNKDMPMGKMTFTFIEVDGKTTVTSVAEYGSEEEIAKLVEMGMIEGLTSAYEKLDAYLISVKA